MGNWIIKFNMVVDVDVMRRFQNLGQCTFLMLLLLLPGCTRADMRSLVTDKKLLDGITCVKTFYDTPNIQPWWYLQFSYVAFNRDAITGAFRMSPDHKSFAYKTTDGIAVLDLKTAATSKLIAGSDYSILGWSSDSKALFLCKYRVGSDTGREVKIYLCRLTQTNQEVISLGNREPFDLRWSPDRSSIYWIESRLPVTIHVWKGERYYLIRGKPRRVQDLQNLDAQPYIPEDIKAYHSVLNLNTGAKTTEPVFFDLVDKKRFCSGECHGYCEFNSRSMLGRPAEILEQKVNNPLIRSALHWKLDIDFDHSLSDDSKCSIPPHYADTGSGQCGLEYTSHLNGAGGQELSKIKMEYLNSDNVVQYRDIADGYAKGGAIWYPGTHAALLRVNIKGEGKAKFLKTDDKGKNQEISLPDDGNEYIPAGILEDSKTILVLKLDKDKKDTASLYSARIVETIGSTKAVRTTAATSGVTTQPRSYGQKKETSPSSRNRALPYYFLISAILLAAFFTLRKHMTRRPQ